MSEDKKKEVVELTNQIKAALGQNAWDRFQDATKIGVITSEICFSKFKNQPNPFDFSSVIIPLMKGLELELYTVFYSPYYKYIKNNYSPQSYVKTNWEKNYPGDEKAAIIRNLILIYTKQGLHFQSFSNKLELGSFRYLVGASDRKQLHIDPTFVSFCEQMLFSGESHPQDDIRDWLRLLVHEVESLRLLRNDSSHGGKILNAIDAKTAIDKLVKVDKIMAILVAPELGV